MASYAYENKGGQKAPSFDRVIEGLSDREILDEIEHERGDPDFQDALRAAAQKRGLC